MSKKYFPLSPGFFHCPALTRKEREHLLALGKQSSLDFINHASIHNNKDIQWTEFGKKQNVVLYRGVNTKPQNTHFVMLCAVAEVAGTLEEVAAMHAYHTPEKLRKYVNDSEDLVDMVTLYDLTPNQEAERTPQHGGARRLLPPSSTLKVSVQWAGMKVPAAASAFVYNRDFCYIETQDFFVDDKGRRGWALSQNSMDLEGCPPLPSVFGSVRGTLERSGYTFVESENHGYLKATQMFQVDFRGKIPIWVQNLILKGRLNTMIHFNTRVHEYRLKSVELLTEYDVRRTNTSNRTNCYVCRKKFRFLNRKFQCRKCGEVICSHCQRTWSIDIPHSERKRKVTICSMCTTSVRNGNVSSLVLSHEGSQSNGTNSLSVPALSRAYSYDEFMNVPMKSSFALRNKSHSNSVDLDVGAYSEDEDPGYEPTCVPVDLDSLLGDSPPIDARWGDDEIALEEECQEYKPNLFRKGFCMNCQKQHQVTDEGDISLTRRFTRIHVQPNKTAASAEFNPLALPENSALSMELRRSRCDSNDSMISLPRSRLGSLDIDDESSNTYKRKGMRVLMNQMSDLMEEYGSDLHSSLDANALEMKLASLQAQLENLQLDQSRLKKSTHYFQPPPAPVLLPRQHKTSQQHHELQAKAKDALRQYVLDSQVQHGGRTGRVAWKLDRVTSNGKVQYYTGQTQDGSYVVAGATQIYATLDEAAILCSQLQPFQVVQAHESTQILEVNAIDQPLHRYVGVQWMSFSAASIGKGRDACVLECRDKFVNDQGYEGYASLIESIDTPECRSLEASHGFVRAKLRHTGYVFTQVRPGLLHVVHTMHIDFKGQLPMFVCRRYAKRRIAVVQHLEQSFWQLRQSESFAFSEQLRKRACPICFKQWKTLQLKKECGTCHKKVCSSCCTTGLIPGMHKVVPLCLACAFASPSHTASQTTANISSPISSPTSTEASMRMLRAWSIDTLATPSSNAVLTSEALRGLDAIIPAQFQLLNNDNDECLSVSTQVTASVNQNSEVWTDAISVFRNQLDTFKAYHAPYSSSPATKRNQLVMAQRVFGSSDLVANITSYQNGFDGIYRSLPASWMKSQHGIDNMLNSSQWQPTMQGFLNFITYFHEIITPWLEQYGTQGLLRLVTCMHPIVPIALDQALYEGCFERWIALLTNSQLSMSHVTWHDRGFMSTWNRSSMDIAISRGHLKFVQYLHQHRVVGSWWVLDGAAEAGYLEILQYLHFHSQTYFCTPRAMDLAAHNGHLDVVKFLHYCRNEGCSHWAMDWAATNGHLNVVKFLHVHRGEGCTIDALNGAAAHGYRSVVQFLCKYRNEGNVTQALEAAARRGHFRIVRFLCRFCVGGTRKSVLTKQLNQFDVIRYLAHKVRL
ncbi:hypothetical protein THRCLA_01027 [Thraustotheca clavata]|uniref:FYVE-type domain-containing protein n=1 Tax=Thraustotheca clavata TaxID=74557 RepID=A0A1W0A9T5_9STRA|nr:hypothetical protein THRCLA_01027 [Thraustotheca clavata]